MTKDRAERDSSRRSQVRRPGSLAKGCYRWLLRLYPAAYRERFGDDMVRTFGAECDAVAKRGSFALTALLLMALLEALGYGIAERLSPTPGVRSKGRSRGSSRFEASLATDVRFALRLLARSPLFAAISVTSLAAGVAATTTIFSLADAVLLQPSPGVREPERLVDVLRTTDGEGFDTLSYPMFEHLRDYAQSLESLTALATEPTALSLSDGARSQRVFGQSVSANFFEVLGVQPALGRFFLPDEDTTPGERPVVVVTHHFWKEQMASDPGVLGSVLRLNRHDFEVVGVADPAFAGSSLLGPDLWLPLAMIDVVRGPGSADLLTSSRSMWLTAMGRLSPGADRRTAQAELATLLAGFRAETPDFPEAYGVAVVASGRLPAGFRMAFGAFVGLLFAMTVGLLGIAGSNVAGMLLARATSRRREVATRLAVGASRAQLLRQLLTENLVLFLVAALVALPLTLWLNRLLQTLLPSLPGNVQLDLSIGARTLIFALGLAVLSGLLFGLAPAKHALRTQISGALHGRSSTAGVRRLRLRNTLVIAQIALSLALVVTSGLFVRTLRAAAEIDPGFRTEDVAVISLDAATINVTGPNVTALADRVTERLESVPGVRSVGYARMIPLQGSSFGLGGFHIVGIDEQADQRLDETDWDLASPGYFDAVGLPLIEGRPFARTDSAEQPLVAIINQTFAGIAWPGHSAVGQRFWLPQGEEELGREVEVVGVAKDAKYRVIGESPRPFLYVPFAQHPQARIEMYVRHSGGPLPANDLRAAIASVEPDLPIVQLQSFEQAASLGLVPQRLAAWIAGGVGTIGVLLAMLGLYAVTAFLVVQRTREIAIRMALGASQRSVRSIVLRQTALVGSIGGAVGVAVALALGVAVQRLSLLVNVAPTDLPTFAGVLGLMAVVLLAASYLPTRRAAATDPATALRAE